MSVKNHLKKLITANNERLQELELQEARKGFDTSPHINTEIASIKRQIESLQVELDVLEGRGSHSHVTIPYVVVAMTRREAEELWEQKVFNDPYVAPAFKEHFTNFKSELQKHGISDVTDFYSEDRDIWIPPFWVKGTSGEKEQNRQPISDIVSGIPRNKRENSGLVKYLSLSNAFFADDHDTRQYARDFIQQWGGIFIIDAISVFHPHLIDFLVQSQLGGSLNVAVLFFSPFDAAMHEINLQVEQYIKKKWEAPFNRFEFEFDHLCEIGVGNLRGLTRWFIQVQHTLPRVQNSPNPDTLDKLSAAIGVRSTGVGQVILSPGDEE